MKKKIKVVIADDHQIIIDGIKLIIEKHENIEVVGEALNGKQLLSILDKKYVDIAIVDINMPILDGIEATQHISKTYPHVKVLILTMHNEKNHILEIVGAGAKGYILKNKSTDDVVEAINIISNNQSYFGKEVLDVLLNDKLKAKKNKEIRLTKKEKQILKLLTKELTTDQIAQELNISSNTVNTHRRSLLKKVGAKNIVGLIKYAIENGLD